MTIVGSRGTRQRSHRARFVRARFALVVGGLVAASLMSVSPTSARPATSTTPAASSTPGPVDDSLAGIELPTVEPDIWHLERLAASVTVEILNASTLDDGNSATCRRRRRRNSDRHRTERGDAGAGARDHGRPAPRRARCSGPAAGTSRRAPRAGEPRGVRTDGGIGGRHHQRRRLAGGGSQRHRCEGRRHRLLRRARLLEPRPDGTSTGRQRHGPLHRGGQRLLR